MEDALELAMRRADQAEVFRVWRREIPADFEANRLKLLQTKESSGLALRIIKDGRVGLSATNDPQDLQGLVDRAIELAQFGAEAKFELPGPSVHPEVELYDPAVEKVTVEEMVRLGQSMIDDLREAESDLLCEARVSSTIATVEIMNSMGGSARYKKSGFGLALEGTLIRGTDMLFIGDYSSSSSPVLDANPLVSKALTQLEMARTTVKAPTGQIPVLFSPHGVASALTGPVTIAFNGKIVHQGSSPLVGRLGDQLFDKRISISDDPTIDLRPGSRFVDDEGVPTRRTSLVKDGRATSFLYDLQTAGLAGAQSTGSASRSLGSLPSPSTSSLIMEGGDAHYATMISDIKQGLLVEQLLGAGQGNVLGGEFGGNVLLGYRIENGRVVGRVKDTVISGNVYEALNRIVAIGSEAVWVGGTVKVPPICCDGVTVSSKN